MNSTRLFPRHLLTLCLGLCLLGVSREISHAQAVVVTFANQLPEKVIVRHVNHRGKVVVPNPDTPVNPGTSAPLNAVPGENFAILLGPAGSANKPPRGNRTSITPSSGPGATR
jgi:hypothetical protein